MKLTSAVLAALIATPLLAQPLPPPAVTVDSTCTGYGTAVLTDGKWVVLGQEITQVYGHRDALGNCGNSWVSAPAEGEHWVRLDWPQAVTLNQISLWWTQPVWWPRAVRVEMLSDTNWVSLTGPSDWLRPTAQHGILTFPQVTARTIRLLQHPQGGEPDRGFLALQEITAQLQPDAKPGLEGVRKLTAEELKGLEPVKLERNIARITDSYGRWWPENIHDYHNAAGLNDGDLRRAVLLPKGAMPGIDLIIPHVIDGAAVFFAGVPPDANQVQLQVAGARERWLPVRTGLQAQRDGTRQGLIFTFEPLATGSLSLRLSPKCPPVTEIEVYRYIPAAPNVWPERLVNGQYERELLATGEEPSFARLSTAALSMTPARALLGLKDDTREVGVTFDGDIITPFPL
ncbi:MAG: hypothetical protein KKI08_02425, partial [Armatimonadetes bacterium]|nr:hypothetical protein [Armatimonadota bacterium]